MTCPSFLKLSFAAESHYGFRVCGSVVRTFGRHRLVSAGFVKSCDPKTPTFLVPHVIHSVAVGLG